MRDFPNTIFNQTTPESVVRAMADDASKKAALGTAVYFIPDPTRGPDAIQSILVEDLPYLTCEANAQYCIAFKWISHEVASYAEILQHKTNRNCTQDLCPSPQCGPLGSICACVGGLCYI